MIFVSWKEWHNLKQQNADLVAALEDVEWVQDIEEHGLYCPWCLAVKKGGHFEECKRQQALGKD